MLKLHNQLTELLQITYPIIQAPMAGGITTSKLVAAVSNAGGLGMIGAGYMSPDEIRIQLKEIRRNTKHPFGINLFIPQKFSLKNIENATSFLKPIKARLNVTDENKLFPTEEQYLENFNEQVKLVIEEKIPVCSFTFGLPSKEIVSLLKEASVIVIGTATTVEEALGIEKLGMDAIVLQGSEAGGHRGSFLGECQESLIGLMSLIPQTADVVTIPLIAAGGIMDARGIAAAMCLGAKGVQMGTAFLTCVESGASQVYKDAILNTTEVRPVLTKAFTGKMARGLKNTFIIEMESETEIPDYPIQNLLTKELRKKSSHQNNPEYMSLWSGQSPRLAKHQAVMDLFDHIISQLEKLEII